MVLSFVDSGILIAAARGTPPRAQRALDILADSDRIFCSSIFIKLEVLPKSLCYQQTLESEFYETFFQGVTYWISDLEALSQFAYHLACIYGLSGLDALNIAAAISLKADEFITTEKPTKPMYRVPNIQFLTV
ncbi:nucleic acid-binding protein [Spirulina sp. CCNP1310]|uniref:type II toxin-antitoxin system VapC family toxin n=1 Tax=Spirulina sp. CCNP1310 TaxID=3110249 RepID=UPI002B20EB05|nr:nucleic acid-binding protein [Spirulina sp. CCNP1310]MEA5419706.1 nucleic acid-binding protein [Spirulina sp. CCNP1310]